MKRELEFVLKLEMVLPERFLLLFVIFRLDYYNVLCFVEDRDDEAKERDQLRHERHKERQRDRNLQRAAPDKRSKLERQRERDISEQIALGIPNARFPSGETQYDQRLFNQSKVSYLILISQGVVYRFKTPFVWPYLFRVWIVDLVTRKVIMCTINPGVAVKQSASLCIVRHAI